MDDIALLRRTIHRCTAVVVVTFATTGISLQRASEASLLVLITVGAVVYLVNEFFELLPPVDSSEDDSGST